MKERTLPAVKGSIPEITAWIEQELLALDCGVKAQMQIDVALDELMANIADYAYGDGTGDVTVRFSFDGPADTAVITLVDRGVPFDPLSAEDPDVSLPARLREAGGLGIFLVKKTMDAVEYRREKGCNVLTIRKRIR